jgi:alpha-tubulin suppressor-like RCC1 family protein
MIQPKRRALLRWAAPVAALVCVTLSVSCAGAQTVSATQTRLLSNIDPSNAGQKITLAAEVDGLGNGAPNGKVTFKDPNVEIGKVALKFSGTGQQTLVAGGAHNCALTRAGGVQCWGSNGQRQLGNGTVRDSFIPVDVVGLSRGVVAISSGTEHVCALLREGTVKCWGGNVYGQLGSGVFNNVVITPVDVVGLSGVVAIGAGFFHTCAITSAGALSCWGRNNVGQLGNGGTADSAVPVIG